MHLAVNRNSLVSYEQSCAVINFSENVVSRLMQASLCIATKKGSPAFLSDHGCAFGFSAVYTAITLTLPYGEASLGSDPVETQSCLSRKLAEFSWITFLN